MIRVTVPTGKLPSSAGASEGVNFELGSSGKCLTEEPESGGWEPATQVADAEETFPL